MRVDNRLGHYRQDDIETWIFHYDAFLKPMPNCRRICQGPRSRSTQRENSTLATNLWTVYDQGLLLFSLTSSSEYYMNYRRTACTVDQDRQRFSSYLAIDLSESTNLPR